MVVRHFTIYSATTPCWIVTRTFCVCPGEWRAETRLFSVDPERGTVRPTEHSKLNYVTEPPDQQGVVAIHAKPVRCHREPNGLIDIDIDLVMLDSLNAYLD